MTITKPSGADARLRARRKREFIADLLEVTGGGKARRFEDVRDHAIIRVLTEGVRRGCGSLTNTS
jgi:hypothetical protein